MAPDITNARREIAGEARNARIAVVNVVSLFKGFSMRRLREGSEIRFRAESFNSLNHPQFGTLNSRVDMYAGQHLLPAAQKS